MFANIGLEANVQEQLKYHQQVVNLPKDNVIKQETLEDINNNQQEFIQ